MRKDTHFVAEIQRALWIVVLFSLIAVVFIVFTLFPGRLTASNALNSSVDKVLPVLQPKGGSINTNTAHERTGSTPEIQLDPQEAEKIQDEQLKKAAKLKAEEAMQEESKKKEEAELEDKAKKANKQEVELVREAEEAAKTEEANKDLEAKKTEAKKKEEAMKKEEEDARKKALAIKQQEEEEAAKREKSGESGESGEEALKATEKPASNKITKPSNQNLTFFSSDKCKNGGVLFKEKCICPSYVSGTLCENTEECAKVVNHKYEITESFSRDIVYSGEPEEQCDVKPSTICCWRDMITKNDISLDRSGAFEDRLQNMLQWYGPWSSNDKLMLWYLFGGDKREGSVRSDYTPALVTPKKISGNIAYVIMIHKDFQPRLEKLIDAIYSPQNYYVIHLDNSAPDGAMQWVEDFLKEHRLKHNSVNIHLVPRRFTGAWGSISLVYQEIAAFIELLKIDEEASDDDKWSYVVNLSAYDFPIKKQGLLEQFFQKNTTRNFLESLSQLRSERQQDLFLGCEGKVHHLEISSDACPKIGPNSNWMYNADIRKYGEGSQWHFLSRHFAEYLVTSIDAVETLFSLKYSLIPDEAFFQTAILSSPFKDTLFGDNYRYLNWKNSLVVKMEEIPDYMYTNRFFTRKVYNTSIADAIAIRVLPQSQL